jgi:serine/threonine-protein kinase
MFGPYRLVELLGEGGMGEVYRAVDTRYDRQVALKLIAINLTTDEQYRRRFSREAEIVARLRNPHVIPIHGYGEIDGHLYLDMRLVEGPDLAKVIERDGSLDPARAIAVLEQIASALDAAHGDLLVHRDVKPGNILLDRNDFAYLVDFGIVGAAHVDAKLTPSGTVLGSLAYAAPERFGGGPADHRVDVYALACVLYEMLTGRQPFAGSEPSAQMHGHVMLPPPDVREHNSAIPPALSEVIKRGMAKNPDDRYGTASALTRAAQDALDEAAPGVEATPEKPVAAPGEAVAAPGRPGTRARRTRRRRRAAVLALTVLTVLGAGTVVWLTGDAPLSPHSGGSGGDARGLPDSPWTSPSESTTSSDQSPSVPGSEFPPPTDGPPIARIPGPGGRGGPAGSGGPAGAPGTSASPGRSGGSTAPAAPVPLANTVLTGHTMWVNDVAAAEVGGRTVAISSSDDETVRVWDIASGTPVRTLTGHTHYVYAVTTAQLGGGPVIVSGSADQTMRVWDLASGRLVRILTGHTHPVTSVSTTVLNGKVIAVSGSWDSTVRVWDLATGALMSTIPAATPVHTVTTTEVGGRAVLAAGGNDGTVRVFDVATGELLRTLTGHTRTVRALRASRLGDRPLLVSAGEDDTIRTWDLTTGSALHTMNDSNWVLSVAITQGKLISAGSDQTLHVWDLATGASEGAPLTGHTSWINGVTAVQFGGRPILVSAGGGDNTVRLWELPA